jgi:hypothetical protein
MILALSMFNIPFWLHIASKKKGGPNKKITIVQCVILFLFFVMGQSKKPITEGKKFEHG